jgi:hypothetical protein
MLSVSFLKVELCGKLAVTSKPIIFKSMHAEHAVKNQNFTKFLKQVKITKE